MAGAVVLKAQIREKVGKGSASAARRQSMTPGVIYGGEEAPEAIAVDYKSLLTETNKPGFFNRVFTLELSPKKTYQVLARDVQLHPVTDTPLHVDFQRVNKDSRIHVAVPLEFINEDKAPGIKLGGLLNIILHNLDVVCPAGAIPEKITIDLAGLNIHQSVQLTTIKLPKNVVAAHPARDNTVVTIAAPSGANEETEKAAAAE